MQTCIQLAEVAGKIIRKVHNSGKYDAHDKSNVGFMDLFTIADVQIQKTIEHNLKSLYPYAKIIGEEDEQYLDGLLPELQPDEIDLGMIKERILADFFRARKEELKKYKDQEFVGKDYVNLIEEEALQCNQEDMVFCIDPLDGTQGFKKGKTDESTVILGK